MTNNFSKTKQSDIPDMLKLKRKGWTLEAIGKKYKIDHTTVHYHLKKLGQGYPKNIKVKKVKKKYTQKYYKKLVSEPIKQYQDYLQEQADRVKKILTR